MIVERDDLNGDGVDIAARIAAVLLGGFISTLYPVCVAHAHDRMRPIGSWR